MGRVLCLVGLLAGLLGGQPPKASAQDAVQGGAAPSTTPEAAVESTEPQAATPATAAAPTDAPAESKAPAAAATPPVPERPRPPPRALDRSADRVRARIAFHQARVDSDERRQAAPTVRGDAGAPFGIGVSVEVPWNTDPSYDVFSDDDVTTRVGLFAAYDLLSIGRDVVAAAELGWAYDGEESSIFAGNVQTELEQHFFHGGVYVRYVLVDWLQPQLRLQGGISTVDLELLAERRFEQDEITPFGKIGAGVMLRTPTRLFEDERGRLAALSLGVLIEGGYGIASPVEVVLDGPGPGAMDIALEEAQLGELKRSGPFVRTSLVARF